jgi:hypothetical protein
VQDRYAEASRFYQWATDVRKQAMLKASSENMEDTDSMGKAITDEMIAAMAALRLPQLSQVRDVRCTRCNRQLLDSPVCMYCTLSGFDAMAILRQAGFSVANPTGSRASGVNALGSTDGLQCYPLREPVVKVGRHPSCNIVFSNDKHVSRYHAMLIYRDGDYYIKDNNTSNGTYVNGQRIAGEVKPLSGDIVLIGSVILHAECV